MLSRAKKRVRMHENAPLWDQFKQKKFFFFGGGHCPSSYPLSALSALVSQSTLSYTLFTTFRRLWPKHMFVFNGGKSRIACSVDFWDWQRSAESDSKLVWLRLLSLAYGSTTWRSISRYSYGRRCMLGGREHLPATPVLIRATISLPASSISTCHWLSLGRHISASSTSLTVQRTR